MYYKTLKGNPTFIAIMDVWNKKESALKQTDVFLKSIGYEESVGYSEYIGGGFDAIKIPYNNGAIATEA